MTKKKLYSLNALATECGRNFRTLSRALSDVRPDGKSADGKPRWTISTAIAALEEHTRKTGRVPNRLAPERWDPELEMKIEAIEESGREVDAFLSRLRGEPNVERRRQMVESGGARCIGAHSRHLEATIGDDAHSPLRQCYVDQMVDYMMSQILALCQWKIEQPEAQ